MKTTLLLALSIVVGALALESHNRRHGTHTVRWQMAQTNETYVPLTNYLGRLTGHTTLELGFMDDGSVVWRPVTPKPSTASGTLAPDVKTK